MFSVLSHRHLLLKSMALIAVGIILCMLSFPARSDTGVSVDAQKLIPSGWQFSPLFTVPRIDGDIELDGRLDSGHWKYTTEIGSPLDANTLMQSNQTCRFYLGYKAQDLLLGFDFFRIKGSGGPRIVAQTPGYSSESMWVRDENVEVWLSPLTEGIRDTGMQEPAYCVAANAAGAYCHDMTGVVRSLIPRDFTYIASLSDNGEHWQGEMRFPWSVVSQIQCPQEKHAPADGVKWCGVFFFQQLTPYRALIGALPNTSPFSPCTLVFSEKPIGFEVSRVGLTSDGKGRFAAGVRNGSASTVHYDLYYEVFRRNETPRSRNTQFMSYWQWIQRIQEVGPELAATERGGILNILAAGDVEADLNRQYTSVDGGTQPLDAGPGEIVRKEISFPASDGYYVLGYRIVERETGKVVMQQVIPVSLAQLPMEVRPEFLKAQKIVVRTDALAVSNVSEGDVLRVRLMDSEGRVMEEISQALQLGGLRPEILVPSTKTRPEDSYVVQADVLSAKDGSVLAKSTRTIRRPANPEWFDSKLGLTDKVLPGFEPVKKVKDGFSVSLRNIVFNGQALPQQIITRGKPFLAAPVQLTAKINGKPVVFKRGKLAISKAKATAAEFSQQWSGEGLVLDIVGRLEYDGFIRYDVKVGAQRDKVRVDELTLVVPVKPEYAQLYCHHDVGTQLAGSFPIPRFTYGDLSAYFDFYKDGWMPFTWQLFLGAKDRGIEWTAESDRAWSPQNEGKMIGIRRGDKSVDMVFKFVDKPVDIDTPRAISFGLTPTPVRDYSRNLYMSYSRTTSVGIGNDFPSEPGKSPQLIKLFDDIKKLDVKCECYYVNFGPDLFSNVRFYDEGQLRKLRGINTLARERGLMGIFYTGYSLPNGIPENDTFGNEMRMEPEYQGWYLHASPFADYWLHGVRFMSENALVDAWHTDGLYEVFLTTNPTYDYSWTRDGKAHGTYPVFAVRDLLKRFEVLLKYESPSGRSGYHVPHIDYGPVYCLEGLSDMGVVGERHYFTITSLEDLSLASYRLYYDLLGHGVARTGIWDYDTTNSAAVNRNTINTLHAVHGVQYEYKGPRWRQLDSSYELFGGFRSELDMWQDFDRVRAEFRPYYDYPRLAKIRSSMPGITLPADAVKVSAYVHPGKESALLIVANLKPVGYSVQLEPDLTALGLTGRMEDYAFTDPVLGGYEYPVVGPALALDVHQQRWRAIRIQRRSVSVVQKSDLYAGWPYESRSEFSSASPIWQKLNLSSAAELEGAGVTQISSDVHGVTMPEGAVSVTSYVQPDKTGTVLLLKNTADMGYTVRITPDLKSLGLPASLSDYSLTDPVLSNYPYLITGNDVRLDIYARGYRLVRMSRK